MRRAVVKSRVYNLEKRTTIALSFPSATHQLQAGPSPAFILLRNSCRSLTSSLHLELGLRRRSFAYIPRLDPSITSSVASISGEKRPVDGVSVLSWGVISCSKSGVAQEDVEIV